MNTIKILAVLFLAVALSACNEDCKEKVKPNCITTFELRPACGCNDKTYDNPSSAECIGIEEYTFGACN
jgi:hypothetical protein